MADTTLMDFAVAFGLAALVGFAVALIRRPITVGCKVRIISAGPERQNAFVGETGTVTRVEHFTWSNVTSVWVTLTFDDGVHSVPFDANEVRRVGWWSL